MKKLSAILAFVLVLLTFTACGSAGYEKVIKAQYDAILEGDADAYMACFANEAYVEYLIDEFEEDELEDEKDVQKKYKESVKDSLEYWEDDKIKRDDYEYDGLGLGKNIKVDIEVLDTVTFEKDDIALFAEYLEEKYDYDKETVQDVVVVNYILRRTGEDGYDRTEVSKVVIKIDGTWYISEDFSSIPAYLVPTAVMDAIVSGIDGLDGEKHDLANAIDGLNEKIYGYNYNY
ncbi:MAG: hypothetical protein IJC81_05670 [Clostridia bacterium]|nr:hypothetical protein [Clostridia bacterium]